MIDTGDTTFIMISAALVMFMVPGLALFYGGMVRRKNVLSTIMQSIFTLAVISIIWAIFGYTLAFGPDKWHFIGSLKHLGLQGIGQQPGEYAGTIPALTFMVYQGMFAAITPALIAGAFAERMKFKAYLIFVILWSILVYSPIAHWVWGGGWIGSLGALDFAGGAVVHISSGAAALVGAIVLGKRTGLNGGGWKPHNLTMTMTGAAILWFGWFGFNAGSALAANGIAANAFVTTHLAAAAGVVSWVTAEWLRDGSPTTLGAASGAIAGLVAITPAAGFVSPMSAIIIGLLGGAICYYAVGLKWKFGYDDSLDVVGVHFAGGTVGALATGLFAEKAINASGENGLFFGNPSLLGIQFISIVAVVAYSVTISYILLRLIDKLVGLRVGKAEETRGLDLSEHSEVGYALMD